MDDNVIIELIDINLPFNINYGNTYTTPLLFQELILCIIAESCKMKIFLSSPCYIDNAGKYGMGL